MPPTVTRAVARVARGQHGLVTRQQLADSHLTNATLHRWVADGRLERVQPRVYRLAGAPRTWEQSVLAAVLAAGPGAAASHRAAARLWGLLDEQPAPEVTVPMPRRPQLHGVIVHRSRDLDGAGIVVRRAVRVTGPLRTLVDLGAVAPAFAVEDALDVGLSRRLFSVAAVDAERARLAKRGRDGAGVLRSVLERRLLGIEPPDSVLEPRMARLLAGHGLPPAAFQHVVRHDGRFVARVDFAYPRVRLAVEVDGSEHHSSPAALQHDLSRQNALVAAGWTPLRFTWADVVRRPTSVAGEVRRVLRGLASDVRT